MKKTALLNTSADSGDCRGNHVDPVGIPDDQIGKAKDERGAYHTRPDGTPLYSERYKTVLPYYNGTARVYVSKRQIMRINKRGEVVWPATKSVAVTADDPRCIPDNQIGIARDARGAYHTRPDGSPLYRERYASVFPFEHGRAKVRLSKKFVAELIENRMPFSRCGRSVLIDKRGYNLLH